jgi:methylphosphotriester-DNA--protein-cysteine methyltransferase
MYRCWQARSPAILLASGHPVIETAIAWGWANPTSLVEAFTAVLGQTPSQYRGQASREETAREEAGPPGH